MNLSEKLTLLRKQKGLSQIELAEALEVSRQAVSRWEVGAAKPTMKNILAISELYEIPVEELLGREYVPEGYAQSSKEAEKNGAQRHWPLYAKKSILAFMIIIVVLFITSSALSITYLNTKEEKAGEQNIVKIEALETERISDSNAVKSGPIS